MKFIRSSSGENSGRAFQMSRREKALLLGILRLFPVLDNSFHHLSRDPKAVQPAEQRLLEQSMGQLRQSSRTRLDKFLAHTDQYFFGAGDDVRLKLAAEEVEWLIRVLNDVRVGSWVQLGCPDPAAGDKVVAPFRNQHAIAAMELSGYFQACLLQAFD